MGASAGNKQVNKPTVKNYVNWFEIPALNLDRAVHFYSSILAMKMDRTQVNGYSMAFFPAIEGVGGAVVSGPGCIPSDSGTLVYLNAGKNLNNALKKVEQAGGRIVMPKTKINEQSGSFAIIIDTEGNKIALHAKE